MRRDVGGVLGQEMGTEMKARKAKPTEPALIDELNKPLRDIVNDIKAHGLDALQTVREKSPEKYLELATKLLPLVAALNPGVSELAEARSMEDIGVQLLRSVGLTDDQMDGELIAQAIAANDRFVAALEEIRDKSQGMIQ
jgi:hypothetical protein